MLKIEQKATKKQKINPCISITRYLVWNSGTLQPCDIAKLTTME